MNWIGNWTGAATALPLIYQTEADDRNILVKSKRAGERVMASVTRFISKSLRLTVNPLKSAVDRPANRKFLGFTVSRTGVKLKVADKDIDKLKDQVRTQTCRTKGTSIGAVVAELRQTLLLDARTSASPKC